MFFIVEHEDEQQNNNRIFEQQYLNNKGFPLTLRPHQVQANADARPCSAQAHAPCPLSCAMPLRVKRGCGPSD